MLLSDEFAQRLKDFWLPTLEGCFLGMESHQDVANLGGFENELLTARAVGPKIDQFVAELIGRSGAGWQRAVDRWGEQLAENHWVIVAAAALRLRAILAHFTSSSTLFFARTLADDAEGDKARAGLMWRDHASPHVSWPVGMKVLLDENQEGSLLNA